MVDHQSHQPKHTKGQEMLNIQFVLELYLETIFFFLSYLESQPRVKLPQDVWINIDRNRSFYVSNYQWVLWDLQMCYQVRSQPVFSGKPGFTGSRGFGRPNNLSNNFL